MNNFMRKAKGAISIFLVLVMMPMLMVSSVFVDMGRINLAKSMAASAGDLTLNTALTNYDSVLKNMYGLFATSQNMDELMANLEHYYTEAIEATGIDEAEAGQYVDQIMGYLQTQTGSDDLMNIDVTGVEVTVPTGASLANPAILKSQVVEFMKYRAPISLGTGFLDALSSMKDLGKQTELVEDKTEFYTQQEGIIKELESAWREMQLYQTCYVSSHNFPTTAADESMYITTKGALLENTLKAKMGNMISDTVCYLYYYGDYKEYKGNICSIVYSDNDTPEDETDDHWKIDDKKITPEFSADDQATAAQVRGELATVLLAIKEVEKYVDQSDKATYKQYKYLKDTTTSSDLVRRVYAVAKFHKSGYADAVKKLHRTLIDLYSAYENCSEPELLQEKYTIQNGQVMKDPSAKSTLATLCQTNLDAHLIDPATDKSPYGKTQNTSYVGTLMDIKATMDAIYDMDHGTIDSKANATSSTTGGLPYVVKQTKDFYDMIAAWAKNLENAATHLGNVEKALSDPNSEYNKALKAWEGSAGNLAGQTMGDNDIAEIKKIKENITLGDVRDLISHLNQKKATLDSVCEKIDAYKYQNTAWRSIEKPENGYKQIRSMMTDEQKNAIEDIMPENESSYKAAVDSVKGTLTGTKITKFWNESTDPDLTKPTRRLFTYLLNNYYIDGLTATSTTSSKVDSGKNDLTNSKNDLKDSANKNNTSKDITHTEVGTDLSSYFDTKKMEEGVEKLPSLEWDGTFQTIENGMVETDQDTLLKSNTDTNSILGDLFERIGNGFSGLRDDLYVSEYIMNMFTYETMEAEIAREVLKIPNSDNVEVEAWYDKQEDGSYKIKDKYAKCVDEAMTLTNVPMAPDSCFLYGSEIEYMVYGSEGGMIDHSDKVKGTIFLIRFALNTVYAFTDAEINNTTLAAATAIFGTPPLTPLIPVAKVAMTIGLAIAESTWDLMELSKGKAVPLMKNNTTWQMKASTAAKKVAAAVADEIIDQAMDAGYEMLNDVLEMTDEELTAMIGKTEDSIKNLKEAVLDSTMDKIINYANEAVQQVVMLCNQVNDEITFLDNYDKIKTADKVKMVTERLEAWRDAQDPKDAIVYEVKSKIVDMLIANEGLHITNVFNAIQQSASGIDLKLDSGVIINPLEKTLDEIRQLVEMKVGELADTAGSKLKELKDGMLTKLESAAAEGVESLRSALKEQVGGFLGESTSGQIGNNHVVANLLNWKYSDYLRLFLIVALIADDEAVMLRMADVIELNMQHQDKIYGVVETTKTEKVSRLFGLIKYDKETTVLSGNDKAFKMSKAYTYLSVSATLEVKPLLMKLPFMSDQTERALNGNEWYQIQYEGIMGY